MIPPISLVMPAYNCQKTVGRAIKHALRALSKTDELVIVDDGSTDNTNELIRRHSDPRITLLVNSTNLGIAKSLNRGIALARHDYICRADADDVTPLWRFFLQKRIFDFGEDDFLFGSQIILWKGAAILPLHTFVSRTNKEKLSKAMGLACILPHPTLMARKEAILAMGGYEDGVAEDYGLWLRGILAGYNFRKHWFPQNIYVISSGSVSRNDALSPNHLGHLKELRLRVFSDSNGKSEAAIKIDMTKFRKKIALRDPFLFLETGICKSPLRTLEI